VSTLFPDTSLEAEQLLLSLLREAPAWRKLEMVDEMNRTVRTFAAVGLKERYPDAGVAELNRRLADLLLGPDLAARAYGPSLQSE
jgi:hypothetical protein